MEEKQKFKQIADLITDTFNEQITDLLISFDIQTEQKKKKKRKLMKL